MTSRQGSSIEGSITYSDVAMTLRLLFLLLLLTPSLSARTLEVSGGGTYQNLEAAAAVAGPGDTILFRAGVYPGGQFVGGLQGRADAWITIMAAPDEAVILRGGGNAWQLSDPSYLRIAGFIVEGQTLNGMNIDDGGSFETPAHHIVIERCRWRGIDAEGNNDQLKMSGVDSFEVRDCIFIDGAGGGSMIDMVGCHDGSFTGNIFERAGSNCIQAKGGSREIRIERNTFNDGGSRAINIGGSTDPQFFRPQGVGYEAANIRVYSNIFVGSDAPIAYVGTINSEVVNNTIWLPGRWAIRILQETTGPEYVECGDNIFANNIVVVDNDAAGPTVNIGPNTRSETFTFANNLWYNIQNPGWSGPNLPAAETNGVNGTDPRLAAPPVDMSLQAGSPAIAAGLATPFPLLDHAGHPFATPRSIGALEGGMPTTGVADDRAIDCSITARPGEEHALAFISIRTAGTMEATLFDLRGEGRWAHREWCNAGSTTLIIPLDGLPAGVFLCMVRCDTLSAVRTIVIRR